MTAHATRTGKPVVAVPPSTAWAAGVWISGIAMSVSSGVALIGLSRHLPSEQISQISGVFVLSMLVSVLPTAVQSQSAAARGRLGLAGGVRWRPLLAAVAALLASAPLVASASRLPLLAVVCVALMLPPAVAAAAVRGDLLGDSRYARVTVNQSVEALVRCVGALVLGWSFGATGMAVGMLLGALAGAATLYAERRPADLVLPLSGVLLGLAALTAAVSVDVLVVPSLIPQDAAGYAVAALPGKGVYLAMVAAGWLLIPRAARLTTTRQVGRLVGALLVAGLALALVASALGPVAAAAMGQDAQPWRTTTLLALAMALAGTAWGALMVVVARAGRWVWLPGIVALAMLAVAVVLDRSAIVIVVGVLGAQAAALLTATVLALRTVSLPAQPEPLLALAAP